MWMPRAPVLSLKVSLEPVYFAPSALRHVAIAAPGPLGRAITFRALGAQNNHVNHKIDSSSILMPLKGRGKFTLPLRAEESGLPDNRGRASCPRPLVSDNPRDYQLESPSPFFKKFES
jgi:hypothetical protein